jgi:uncharacterized membrane protein YjgN (DUF898 family)
MVAFYGALRFIWAPVMGARLQNLVWGGTCSEQMKFASRLGLYRPFAVVATTRLKLEAVHIALHGDIDTWLADAKRSQSGALGEMGGDVFGFDLGL